jgi:competence protein ComEC
MKEILFKNPMGVLSALFALGIGMAQLIPDFPFLLLMFLVLSIIGAVLFRHTSKVLYMKFLIFLLLGIASSKYWYLNNINHPINNYLPQKFDKANCVVIQPPEDGKKNCIVHLNGLEINENFIKIERDVILKIPYFISDLLPGDNITVVMGDLASLKKLQNPGQFDYQRFLENKGIFAQIEMDKQSHLVIEKSGSEYRLLRYAHILRQTLEGIAESSLDQSTGAFISAILFGEKQGLSSSVRQDFQNSGVAHVLAISGLHVSFIVYFIHVLLSFLPLSFKWQNILVILFILIYMIVSGMNPPVVRATIMVVIVLIGINLEYKSNVYNSLFTAVFLILAFQPQQLFSLSFQFSVTAVLSILIFYKLLKSLEISIEPILPQRKILRVLLLRILQLFLVSLAAQIGTIPLTAYYFNQIPLISIFLNLLVIPLVGIIIPIGFLVIIWGAISPAIALILGDFLSWLTSGLFWLVNFAANVPGAYFQIPQIQFLDIAIYFSIIILIFFHRTVRNLQLRFIPIALVILAILYRLIPTSSDFEILVFDVGQGSSVLITTTGNQSVLYDAGPADNYTDSGEDIILPAIRHLGSLHINKVILSHPHSDHIGGIFSLAEKVRIDSVFLPPLETSYSWHTRTIDFLRKRHIPFRFVKIGDIITIDPWTKLYILAPFPENLTPGNTSGKSINNISLVCLIKSASGSVLLTGDTESDSELKILAWQEILHSQLLLLGHHGSITSSSPDFLRAISPEYGLISVGKDNHFDHPSPIILDRLRSLNIDFLRTDLIGAIWLRNKEQKWETVNWREDN